VGYLSFAPDDSEYVDAQEVELRDCDGAESVPVLLEHDLTRSVSDGDEVRLVGIPRASRVDNSTVADVWVESVSMECLTDSTR